MRIMRSECRSGPFFAHFSFRNRRNACYDGCDFREGGELVEDGVDVVGVGEDGFAGVEGDADLVFAACVRRRGGWSARDYLVACYLRPLTHLVCSSLLGAFLEQQQSLPSCNISALVRQTSIGRRDNVCELVNARDEGGDVRSKDGIELAEVREGPRQVEGQSVESVCIGAEACEEGDLVGREARWLR